MGLVLEFVRLSVNEQFSQLTPRLYPGELATRPQPFDSMYAMWLALGTLANNLTPVMNSANSVSLPAVSGGRVSAPSGLPPAAPGGARHRRLLYARRLVTATR